MTPFAPVLAALTLVGAGPAFAQMDGPPGASPGIAGDRAIDPAPGATQPYLGHPGAFYDPIQRLQAIDNRAAVLAPRQAGALRADLRRIHVFADQQRSRHGGELRDWDREHMNDMMNQLEARYPRLGG